MGTLAAWACTWLLAFPSWVGPLLAAPPPGEPPAFEDLCFDDFDVQSGYPGVDRLKEMLAPVPGHPGQITATTHHARPICQISGWLRLKPPWRADSVLRLALLEQKDVQLHFCSGPRGVTLRYYPDRNHAWAAYGTTRPGNQPQPETHALWAVDNGRYYRSRAGTLEIRWQDGQLVVTRGDLVLLVAPLGGPPRNVFFQGGAKVRGLAMIRSKPVPLPAVSRPPMLRVDEPAELTWKIRQEGEDDVVRLNRLPDGRVELVAEENTKSAQAGVTICRPGLYEYLFEIEDAQPGTGIYLGNQQGEHLCRFAFFRHKETGRTVFDLQPSSYWDSERSYNFSSDVTPFAGRHQWVRLVTGAGVLRCWISGDGVHWSEPRTNAAEVRGACTEIGLACSAGDRKRAIKLRSVELRRLVLLGSLAPQEIMQRVGSLAGSKSFEEWQHRVAESRPIDVPEDLWRRACSLHTISHNLENSLSQPVVHRLVEEVLAGAGDWQFKLRLLDEACLLVFFDNYGDHWNAPPYAQHYQQLGKELIRRGHPAPFTTVSRAVMRMPGWSIHAGPFPQELLRHELLTLAQQQRWQDLGELCRRLKYWTRISQYQFYWLPWQSGKEVTVHLLNWADAQAAQHAPKPVNAARSAVTAERRHPLIAQLSKESYNVYGELAGALDGQAYRAACQIIASSADYPTVGLLPHDQDPRLLVALPTAIDLAMLRWPALRRTMRQQFGPLGQLRIKQAIADGDPAAVEAVTYQFRGTEAAAEAHRWLGDRELSGGRFARACGHYRSALRSRSPAQRDQVHARLRLAAAMMGRDSGRPVAMPVEIGWTRFSAGGFEHLVRQAYDARRGPDPSPPPAGDGTMATLRPCPPPARYEVRGWARIDGGNDKQPGGLPKEGFDWGARQIAVVVTGGRMIVNNQVRQIAFDLNTGGVRWQKQRDLNDRQPQWSQAPMWPVVDHGRIFVRRLSDKGPELACLDGNDGNLLWSTSPAGPLVCDPLLVGQELVSFTASEDLGWKLSLELVAFDPETGELRRRVPVARFHDHWSGAVACRAVAVDGEIIATVGGTALCCDLSGRLRWIRRQIWTPPPKDLAHAVSWLKQVHRVPLVVDDRIWATQPGVWAVECIELDTGRLLWRTALPELSSLAGRVGSRLIVETTDGLLALGADTGKVVWRHDAEDRLDTRVCGGPDAVCYVRLEPTDRSNPNRPRRPVLVWIDPQTGRTAAESTLEVSIKDNLRLGPLIVHGERQWALIGQGDRPGDREIRELARVNP